MDGHVKNLRNQPATNGKEFPRAMQQGRGIQAGSAEPQLRTFMPEAQQLFDLQSG
jgi:hypothetical protein